MRRSLLAIGAAVLAGVIATPMAHGAPPTGDAKRACADVVEGRAAYETVEDAQDPKYAEVQKELEAELGRLRDELKVPDEDPPQSARGKRRQPAAKKS